MPTFCRHNRLIQNCPICAREQEVELRAVISSSAPRSAEPRRPAAMPRRPGRQGQRPTPGLTVKRLARDVDDGFRSPLVPGLKSSAQAARLADEVALAALRLATLESDPPGLYAEVARSEEGLEERSWLAFLIACLGPLDGERPFEAIEQARVPWSAALGIDLTGVRIGPRAAHDPASARRTIGAYVAWAERAGSQAAGLTGDPGWSAERRFERVFERLALPGLHRDARFDLLVTLGRLGVFELRAPRLAFGGADEVTVAAKRILGIGDPLLLERRAAALAEGCGVSLEALDPALYNWSAEARARGGLGPDREPAPELVAVVRGALGL